MQQQKTTNPPPPRTQKGAKTLSNPHQCSILPRGGGGVGVSIDRCIKVLRLAMEHADGDKCRIVFTSPEAMMEFSDGIFWGKKVKT